MGFRVAAAGAAWNYLDQVEGMLIRSGGTGAAFSIKGSRANGVETYADLASYPSLNEAYSRKNIGMRWFRKEGRCFLLGEGHIGHGVETKEIAIPAEFKSGGSLYNLPVTPWFGTQAYPSKPNQEQMANVRARWGNV
ncbi:hypothetical protein [Sphingomonas sp. BK069]|uniref:hypothetical protein n=1 Tax=Sphingomonas sp. BK069 TaxID=2586979 RepID=UPI00160F90E2|nr:hypothetical protein [Sphingomonas sp. BK069]MBB3348814.1 hypothetical protein [Sphingomonas sp. BK069]